MTLANASLELTKEDRDQIRAAIDDLSKHYNDERNRLAGGYYDN